MPKIKLNMGRKTTTKKRKTGMHIPKKAMINVPRGHPDDGDPYWYVPEPEPVVELPTKYEDPGPMGQVDRSGMFAYVHLILGPDDPEPKTRKERYETEGYETEGWKDMSKTPVSEWERRIMELLSDKQPRTFHLIMMKLTNYMHRADVAFCENPDIALWSLVKDEKLYHTMEVPVHFYLPGHPPKDLK